MKVVIFLLAALCSVFADEAAHQMDPCLQQCKEQTKTKLSADEQLAKFKPEEMASPEGRTKLRTFMKKYITGDSTIPVAVGSAELWTKLCTVATEAETCINACPDSPKKEGAKKFMSLFKLGCDADFKSSIGCLVEVNKQKSEPCQTKCQPLAAKWSEFIEARDAAPAERVNAPKDVLESSCKFINCRLNCRKTDIVNKCQASGFEQAKKLTSAVVTSSKVLYKRVGGDAANWPEICLPEKIIEANEY